MKKDDSTTVSQPRVLFVAQYILVEDAMHSAKKAQCILIKSAMHSGKTAQCILVKSDEFENRTPFYIFFLNPVYVAARSLRSNNLLQHEWLRMLMSALKELAVGNVTWDCPGPCKSQECK